MTDASRSPSPRRRSSGTATTATRRGPFAATERMEFETEQQLSARGLDPEVCSRMGVSTAVTPDGGDGWVAIPFFMDGKVVNHKYRRIIKAPDKQNFSQDKGGKQCFWNHDAITDVTLADQPLLITEGEFDALAALQSGFVRVVSVPGGAPGAPVEGDGKYGFLVDVLPYLKSCKEIIICTDDDKPGHALLQDLGARLGRGRCRYVTYPAGCKDLLDVLLGYGSGAVVEAVMAAKWLHVPGLYRMSDLPPFPDSEPLCTMIPGMHEHFKLRKGDFTVITGVPSSGKSTFVNDLCCRMAHHHHMPTCFASFEQHPQTDHRRALRTWFIGKKESSQSEAEIASADTWIDANFSFVVGDEDEDCTLDWLLDKLASAVIRYGAEIVVIDPWNEMDHAKDRMVTMTEYTGIAIRTLKKFARKWNVHVMVVAHPSKMLKDKSGSIPCPSLYDIAESSHWFNKPDIGIVVHPEHDDTLGDYTAVHVKKIRYQEKIGRPGVVKLRYQPHTAKFEAA